MINIYVMSRRLLTLFISTGGIVEQTEQTLNNLTAILKEAGVGLNSIVKATRMYQFISQRRREHWTGC